VSRIEALTVVLGLGIGFLVVWSLLGSKKAREGPNSRARTSASNDGPLAQELSKPGASTWDHVLGVSPDAPIEEIKAAYRRLIGQYHPDKVAALGPELRDLAETKSKEILSAYAAARRVRNFDE